MYGGKIFIFSLYTPRMEALPTTILITENYIMAALNLLIGIENAN